MHISTLAAAGLLTIAAFTPGDASAQNPAERAPYKALGTEPFWALTITPQTMKFERPDGPAVSVPTPRVIHGFAGEIYQTRRINVNIVHKRCSDGMSDRTYPDTVQVSVDGRQYQGCGGAAAVEVPRPIVDGSWRVRSIAGRPVVPGTTVTIRFENGRVSGNTGCNAFSGRFSFERGRLSAGPLITTKRACTRFTGTQEQDFLQLLGQRLSVSRNRGGKLVLTGARGRTLVLAPEGGRR
ncbi:META domain-containing protein [Sphingomonas sp. LB-2]|uniref:META domain-containing protein n=1 Tax=Sphingomonas caeni TaxID=2984949 RepID=UPI002231B1F9|nr:META domain-containing protein [Sphingomonas caeni]MCW3848753.1 META domain-containing protein [Sphingomonas caeni]